MCIKEIKLRRGWACVEEGERIPEGALVLTKPVEELSAYRDLIAQAFLEYLEWENLAENSLVITDGKTAYAFRMPNAKLTVFLYVDDPAEEADRFMKYLDGTERGFLIDRRAKALFYMETGRALPVAFIEVPEAAPQRLAQPGGPQGPPAARELAPTAEPADAPASPVSSPAGEDICARIMRDGELSELVSTLVKVYDKSPEAAREAVRRAWILASG